MLFCLIQSHHFCSNASDPLNFWESLNVHISVVAQLSKLAALHSSDAFVEIMKSYEASKFEFDSSKTDLDIGALSNDVELIALDDGATRVASCADLPQQSKVTLPPVDVVLVPKSLEVLCWLFRIFNISLQLNPESVIAFSTKDNISNLAKLLYQCGPTGRIGEFVCPFLY